MPIQSCAYSYSALRTCTCTACIPCYMIDCTAALTIIHFRLYNFHENTQKREIREIYSPRKKDTLR